MAKERIAYINGEIVPESQAKVSISDLGFLYGDAAFDTTRTFGHRIFKLQEHLDRFYESLKYMRIEIELKKSDLADLTMQVLEANLELLDGDDDYWVTQRATRGIRGGGGPTIVVECWPLPFAERAKFFRDGVPVVTPSVRRVPPEALSPRVKTHNYLNLVHGILEAKGQNPDALSILLDTNGNLCEGSGANIFVVKKGVLLTPKEHYVLAGISRQTTIELAHELGIEVGEEDIDPFDAYTADEVFITSTSWCICPVSTLNGATIGDGSVPGPVTDRLQKAYSNLVGIDIVGQYLARL